MGADDKIDNMRRPYAPHAALSSIATCSKSFADHGDCRRSQAALRCFRRLRSYQNLNILLLSLACLWYTSAVYRCACTYPWSECWAPSFGAAQVVHSAACCDGDALTQPQLAQLQLRPRARMAAAVGGGCKCEPHNVTAVIMNFDRPANVRRIVQQFVRYKYINEIIICMIKEDTAFTIVHDKVKVVDCGAVDKQHGLNTRFVMCTWARNDWVLVHDDDVLTREWALNKMLVAKASDPHRAFSFWGRRPLPGLQYDWKSKCGWFSGPCPIALTKAMLVDRFLCNAYFNHTSVVEDFVRQKSKPFWNGEDIFMSLVSIKEYGKLPYVINDWFTITRLSEGDAGVSSWPHHKSYRTALLQRSVAALGLARWFASGNVA